MLASGGRDNTVRLWNLETRPASASERKFPMRLDERTVVEQRLNLSPDGLWLTTAYTNRTFSVWHTPTLTESARHPSPFDYLESLAVSPGARWLALGGSNGVLKLAQWNPYREHRSTNLGGAIKRLQFSPDGQRLAFVDVKVDAVDRADVADRPLQEALANGKELLEPGHPEQDPVGEGQRSCRSRRSAHS
jgi:WD40 repeat protein